MANGTKYNIVIHYTDTHFNKIKSIVMVDFDGEEIGK